MITHVQTALRKAGNYDKTGRARKNMRAAARFSCTQKGRRPGDRRRGRGVARDGGGVRGETRGFWVIVSSGFARSVRLSHYAAQKNPDTNGHKSRGCSTPRRVTLIAIDTFCTRALADDRLIRASSRRVRGADSRSVHFHLLVSHVSPRS